MVCKGICNYTHEVICLEVDSAVLFVKICKCTCSIIRWFLCRTQWVEFGAGSHPPLSHVDTFVPSVSNPWLQYIFKIAPTCVDVYRIVPLSGEGGIPQSPTSET